MDFNVINQQNIKLESTSNTFGGQSSSTFAISIFFIMVAVVLFFTIFKKFYFYFIRRKRYYVIPRVSVYGMTNIAMVIAIAVSIIILIMAVTGGIASVLFRVYPGTRVTIEIILVKIAGLLFGPIIGLVSGAIIDALAVALSAGFFHYGYFIAAILTGMLSGLLRVAITTSKIGKRKDLFLSIYSSIFMIVSAAITIGVISGIGGIAQNGLELAITGTGIDIFLSTPDFFYIIVGFTILVILFIWLIYIIWSYKSKRYYYPLTNFTYKQYKHANHKSQFRISVHQNSFNALISVVVLASSSALITNILFLPIFDSEITAQPYTFWLLFRTIVAPFLILLDIIVIYPVLLVISPIIKYNYEDELVEDLKQPIFYDTWNIYEGDKMEITKEEIIACSEALLFKPDEKQLEKLKTEFSEILIQFEKVASIDTENVKQLDYPIDVSCNKFREDVVCDPVNASDIMSCPKETVNNLVKVF